MLGHQPEIVPHIPLQVCVERSWLATSLLSMKKAKKPDEAIFIMRACYITIFFSPRRCILN